MNTDYELQEQRRAKGAPAYVVWICGICDSHTEELNDGDHLCETCGARFDSRGAYIPADDD